jgi:hypothetical protein
MPVSKKVLKQNVAKKVLFSVSLEIAANSSYATFTLIFIHCKKLICEIPVPRRDVTNQTLPGREFFSPKLPGKVLLIVVNFFGNNSVPVLFLFVCWRFPCFFLDIS